MDFRDTADLICNNEFHLERVYGGLAALRHDIDKKQEKRRERVRRLLDAGWREYKIIGLKDGIATEAESVFVPPGTTFAPEFTESSIDNTDDLRDMINGEGYYADEEEE